MKTTLLVAAFLSDGCAPAAVTPIKGSAHLGVRQNPTHEGTSHYSESLTLSVAGHDSLSFVANEEAGVLPPIVVDQIAIDPRHVVVVGWSSSGGGMQTVDAILVAVDDKALVLVDRLSYTAARGDAFVETTMATGALQIGIPESAGRLHEPGDWKLSWGSSALGSSELLALPFKSVLGARVVAGLRTPTAAVWFDIDARGFHPVGFTG